MKLHYLFVFVFVYFTLHHANAQKASNGVGNLLGILYQHPRGVEGSTFLSEDWCSGNIKMYDGSVVNDVRLKYDILKNDLVFYNPEFKRIFIIDPVTISSFTMVEKQNTMYFIKYNGVELGYRLKNNDLIHVLYNGKIKLLAKHTSDISEANDINSKDKIYPKDYYFIQNGDVVHEIKLKLNSVLRLFPKQKQKIKKLASEIHFRRKSETEMHRLIEGIDTLLNE
ncbi:MAG: hypothetical protein PF541_19180 [Prolixibacteraceae bacterium]|jgi:hypothetical protein|nr:hypothetical protein [Prolixibacteraceae bacterium]